MVIPSGIVIEYKAVAASADGPIDRNEAGRFIVDKLLQYPNPVSPMEVKVLGKLTLTKAVHPANA